MVFVPQPISAEVDPDAWIGLWIGEGQIGDFPDFGTFSLGDDYIMISALSIALNARFTTTLMPDGSPAIYTLPVGCTISCEEREHVQPGDVLARISVSDSPYY